MSSHFLGTRASVRVVVAPEDKHYNSECPPSSSFLLVFITKQMSYGMEYSFGQFGSAVPAVSSHKFLPTRQPTGEGEMLGKLT